MLATHVIMKEHCIDRVVKYYLERNIISRELSCNVAETCLPTVYLFTLMLSNVPR